MPFPVPSDVRAKTDELSRLWMAAFQAKDAEAVAATYTSNGKAMPAGAPTQSGRKAIGALLQGVMDMGVDRVELQTDEIFASDSSAQPDCCYEIAQYTFYDKAGNVVDKGKYLAILQQEDGEWKYLYDMFSSNGALPAAQ